MKGFTALMAGAMIVNAAYGTTCADGEYTDE